MSHATQPKIGHFFLCIIIAAIFCRCSWAGGFSSTTIDYGLAIAQKNNITNITRSTQSQIGFQGALLAAVNRERSSRGLALLCTNTKMQNAAQKHSNDMAAKNFMSHTSSNGASLSQRITASGFKWTSIGENVAAGQKDVAAVMESWMNSAGHKKNILGSKFKMFGSGYAYEKTGTYKHYWTQDFGTGSSESCAS